MDRAILAVNRDSPKDPELHRRRGRGQSAHAPSARLHPAGTPRSPLSRHNRLPSTSVAHPEAPSQERSSHCEGGLHARATSSDELPELSPSP
eukprot:965102-Amphidinium_carterae.4